MAEKLYSEGTEFAKGWNFGAEDDDARPVQWIVEHLTSLWGEGARWELDANPQVHEARFLKLDCSQAKVDLGWSPRWRIEESLLHIAGWYKDQQKRQNMRNITMQQIESFSKKIPSDKVLQ